MTNPPDNARDNNWLQRWQGIEDISMEEDVSGFRGSIVERERSFANGYLHPHAATRLREEIRSMFDGGPFSFARADDLRKELTIVRADLEKLVVGEDASHRKSAIVNETLREVEAALKRLSPDEAAKAR